MGRLVGGKYHRGCHPDLAGGIPRLVVRVKPLGMTGLGAIIRRLVLLVISRRT